MKTPQSVELEIEILKSRVDSLEAQNKWLMSNWVSWNKNTRETGQRLMIALEELTKK